MGNIVTDDGSPSEYGGYPRNVQNRVTPSGRVVAMTTKELAQAMRREGLSDAHGERQPARRVRRPGDV